MKTYLSELGARVAISLGLLLICSCTLTLAGTISLSTAAPTTDVYTSFAGVAADSTTIGNVWRNWKSKTASDYDQTTGATFQIGSLDIIADKISILVARTSAQTNVPMKFVLYHASQQDDAGGDFLGTSGAPTVDTVVAEFVTTVNLPAMGSTGMRYVTFDFDDVNLSAGEWYGFYGLLDGYNSAYGGTTGSSIWKSSFVFNTASNANSASLRVADTNRNYILAQGSGTGYDGDIAFWVQGVEIPEPSTMAILVLGLTALGLARGSWKP